MRSDRNADAGRGHEFIAFDGERLGHRLENLAAKAFDRVAVLTDRLQHHELVAAEPGDEMAARGLLHAAARLDQQRVAGRMTKRVVDDLELIKIEAVKREQVSTSFHGAEQMIELLVEHGAVGKRGQHVVEGELGDTLLAFGDLADHFVEARGKPRELVLAAHADLDMFTRRQAPCRLVEPCEGLCDPSRRFPRRQGDEQQAEQRHDAERQLELARVGQRMRLGISEQKDRAVAVGESWQWLGERDRLRATYVHFKRGATVDMRLRKCGGAGIERRHASAGLGPAAAP